MAIPVEKRYFEVKTPATQRKMPRQLAKCVFLILISLWKTLASNFYLDSEQICIWTFPMCSSSRPIALAAA